MFPHVQSFVFCSQSKSMELILASHLKMRASHRRQQTAQNIETWWAKYTRVSPTVVNNFPQVWRWHPHRISFENFSFRAEIGASHFWCWRRWRRRRWWRWMLKIHYAGVAVHNEELRNQCQHWTTHWRRRRRRRRQRWRWRRCARDARATCTMWPWTRRWKIKIN